MNINQLETYNRGQQAKFKDTLNPAIWDRHEHIKNSVREPILVGIEEYCQALGITESAVKDVVISGATASYNYDTDSTIDVVVVADIDPDPVYRELFNEQKYKYNGQHRVEVSGHLVQFYVHPSDESFVSQGSYSVINESWVQIPRRRLVESNDTVKQLKELDLLNRPYQPAPVKKKAVKERQQFKYGYGRDRLDEVGLTPDGTNPSTCMFTNEDEQLSDEDILKDFIDFCSKELKLRELPAIKLRRDPQWSVVNKTFGRYRDDRNSLEVAWGQRHIMDILRTVAHELTHRRQHEREAVPHSAGETGSPYENEANARAGVLMRDYARLHPEYFAVGQAHDLHESSGYIPTAAEANDPRFEMALSVDVRPGALGRAANALDLHTDSQGHPQLLRADGLFESLMSELKEFKKKTVVESKTFNQCYATACKLFDQAESKGLNPVLVQVAGYIGDGSQADNQWLKLPQEYWQHYVTVVNNTVLDPTARQFGPNKPTKYPVGQLSTEWNKQYQIKPKEELTESNSLSGRRVLSYIKKVHPKGEFTLDSAVTNHPLWDLTNVPLTSLHIDPEDVSPYGQINWIDYDHVADITAQDIASKPIVADANGWILDGNHRAVRAQQLGLKSIPAYVPNEDVESDQETYDEFMARQGK